jgi:hypothetical protein
MVFLALLTVITVLLTSTPARAQGSSEGFGNTVGGAGQPVVRVTNLADSGPGSLRAALAAGQRTIVFDVGGEIVLRDYLRVRGAFVTIDGSTAPPPGITLRNRGLILHGTAGAHDVVVRQLRIRNSPVDGIQIAGGASRILIDHVSIHGSGDGALDITGAAHDVTVSWSIFNERVNPKAMLIKYNASRVTLHHNLFVSMGRNPQVEVDDGATTAHDTTVDMRNNLVWDWGFGFGTWVRNGAWANLVNNFYSSPSSGLQLDRDQAILVDTTTARAFTAGNVSADVVTVDLNALGNAATPFPAPAVPTYDACVAAHMVAAGAGVRPLDAIDELEVSAVVLPPCVSGPPALVAVPDRLDFSGTPSGLVRGPQQLFLTDHNGGALAWTATPQGVPWLAIAPATGSTPATLTLVPQVVGLDPGLSTGAIVFEAAAGNSPFSIPVTLALQPGPQTIQLPLGIGLDDGSQLATHTVRTGDTVLRIGRGYLTALRFPGIPLTQGAQIRSAILRTYSPYTTSAVVHLRYYAEAADHSLPLVPVADDFSRRSSTVNIVADTPGSWVARTYNATPDLGAVIQEIVDRPGWVPGNALTILIADDLSPSYRLIGSFETSPASTRAAILEITVR